MFAYMHTHTCIHTGEAQDAFTNANTDKSFELAGLSAAIDEAEQREARKKEEDRLRKEELERQVCACMCVSMYVCIYLCVLMKQSRGRREKRKRTACERRSWKDRCVIVCVFPCMYVRMCIDEEEQREARKEEDCLRKEELERHVCACVSMYVCIYIYI